MTKEMTKLCLAVNRKLKAERKKNEEPMEKDRRGATRGVQEIWSSMDFSNNIFEDVTVTLTSALMKTV